MDGRMIVVGLMIPSLILRFIAVSVEVALLGVICFTPSISLLYVIMYIMSLQHLHLYQIGVYILMVPQGIELDIHVPNMKPMDGVLAVVMMTTIGLRQMSVVFVAAVLLMLVSK